MPSDFNQAIKVVLANEGGYVFNPNDPGGETNFGISKRSYPSVDIKNLTQDEAAELYRHDYWLYGDLNNQDIATKLLDMSVNIGISRAVTICQLALDDTGAHVNVDGKWGPNTEGAVNAADGVVLLPEIRTHQSMYYTNLVAQKPELYQFLRGWLRRTNSC